jgi:hypothetical protein
VGDFVYEIALAWWVLQKTGSAETMSLVLIFAITPSVHSRCWADWWLTAAAPLAHA